MRTIWSSWQCAAAIQYHAGRASQGRWIDAHPDAVNDNFNLQLFLERYASDDG